MRSNRPDAQSKRGSTALRILITNLIMSGRSGTEIFVEQLADWLRRQGHTPIVYAPLVGPFGEAMRARGHFVHDRIGQIQDPPDAIHGHHAGPTMTALAAFPGVPAIFVSHSVEAEFDRPPEHPAIRHYYAVSALVRDRWATAAIPAARTEILSNAVDTDRFRPRPPLPPRPARALLVTKYGWHAERVRAACLAQGLALEEVGSGLGRVADDLPALFQEADIVFASGRSALEAAASGCAVVLTEGHGLYGMVRAAEVDHVIRFNWGVHLLRKTPDVHALADAAAAYDPADAAAVTAHVRNVCPLDAQGARLLAIYAALQSTVPANADHAQAIAGFLESHVPNFAWDRWRLLARHFAFDAMPPDLAGLAEAQRHFDEDGAPHPTPPGDSPHLALEQEVARLRQRVEDLTALQEATYASTCWKVTAPLRRVASALRRHT